MRLCSTDSATPEKMMRRSNSFYGPASAYAHEQVRLILKEAMQVEPDWNRLSLNEAGDYVESEMHKRYPELSPKALEAIGNYYTYLIR